MWSGIWYVAITRIGFWTWIWPLGKWFILDPNVTCPYNSGSKVAIFFMILYNKRGQDLYANHISGFSTKNLPQSKWTILVLNIPFSQNCEFLLNLCNFWTKDTSDVTLVSLWLSYSGVSIVDIEKVNPSLARIGVRWVQVFKPSLGFLWNIVSCQLPA